jgi:hypothetical protein
LLDRLAIGVSGLCIVHCVATTILLTALSTVGNIVGSPLIHEGGLVLAIGLGAVALGRGLRAHRRLAPLAIGVGGLTMMALAFSVPHGDARETLWTVAGVACLALGHALNARAHVYIAPRG